jgi:hypothetical protein
MISNCHERYVPGCHHSENDLAKTFEAAEHQHPKTGLVRLPMSRTFRRATVCVALWAACSVVARDVRAAGTAEDARAVLRKYCYRCHGSDGRNEGALNVVTDMKKLVESKRVIPGESDRSKLLRQVVVGDMPPEVDLEDQSASPKPLPRPTPDPEWCRLGWTSRHSVHLRLAPCR